MGDITTISFKSVGVRYTEQPVDTSKDDIPIAIKMPMKLGQSNDGLLAMTFSLPETIKQNLKNLILTNWGERIGRYNYGANLRPLSFEFGEDQFDNELALRIKSAVSKWMPYVDLTDLFREVEFVDQKGLSKVRIKISYSVPLINLKQDAIEAILYVAG